jgi:hypothetical protein
MTDTFANGPSAPGDAASQPTGDVTGTLAELERKLRELERELTSIGRRREVIGESAAPDTAPAEAPTPPSGRLVDEAIEPPTPIKPPTPITPLPVEPAAPSEPAGSGQPVKFVRPLESARPQFSREPAGRSEPPAGREPHAPSEPHRPSEPHTPSEPYRPSEPRSERQPQPAPEPGERPRPTEAQLASLAELRRFRDRLERFARDLAAEYDALLSRVMAGLTSASAPASPTSAQAPPGSPQAAYTPPASTPPVATPPAAPPAGAQASREETMFEGRVELGVGPFYDIASLSAFERRLASLPHVSEASVRRFEASHAVVDLQLAAPVALVQELRRTGETDFNVREVADGRLLLTFDDG